MRVRCATGDVSEPAADSLPEAAARRRHLEATGSSTPVLPFGVTLLGPAWTDRYLWDVAEAFYQDTGLRNGPSGHSVTPYRSPS